MSRTENPDPRDGVPDAEAAGRARLPRTAGPASAGPPRRRAASPAGNSCVPEIAPPRIVAVTRATAAIGLIALLIVLLV